MTEKVVVDRKQWIAGTLCARSTPSTANTRTGYCLLGFIAKAAGVEDEAMDGCPGLLDLSDADRMLIRRKFPRVELSNATFISERNDRAMRLSTPSDETEREMSTFLREHYDIDLEFIGERAT